MRRSLVIFVSLATVCVAATFAQQPGRVRQSKPDPVDRTLVDPELWRVLADWSEKSAGIDRLEGEILRRKYETTFGVERMGEGYFYYEAPDKGRLDLHAVKITPQLLAERNKKDANVKRRKGIPYKLVSEQPEKWVCDGERIISMGVDEKTATVGKLPEELQGKNIMNGPLPFLFGLPPQEAVNRFTLELTRRPTQQNPFAWLKATPKRPDDAKEWREAEVILDTKAGLPAYVRLLKPSGNLEEVYRFTKLKVNSRVGTIISLLGRHPFKVDLRGYQVNMGNSGPDTPAEQSIVKGDPQTPVVPNLVGMSYKQAETTLSRLGIQAENIAKYKGIPARNKADEHRIRRQKPQAGSPITGQTSVALEFWTTVQ